jgi:hypothetical protein
MSSCVLPKFISPNRISILEGAIKHFQAQGHVLVCGDLNARTGQEPDTLSTQGDKNLLGSYSIPSQICSPRHNYDKTTNKKRSQLLQLCCMLDLYIVHGRLRGDSYGRYTYSSSLGSSTVDYFIIDLNPESLRVFIVSPLTSLSDHSKITVYLNRAILNHEASKPKELHNIKKCYRWKESSVEIFNNKKQLGNNTFYPF